MAKHNKETIKHLCRLCRIDVGEEEIPQLYEDLKGVLDYIDLLQEVDVSTLAPYSHMNEQTVDTLREDEVGDLLETETFLANAPDSVGGMIRVPPVIRKDA